MCIVSVVCENACDIGNEIGDDGVEALGVALQNNTTMTKLAVWGMLS